MFLKTALKKAVLENCATLKSRGKLLYIIPGAEIAEDADLKTIARKLSILRIA
ncbi:hypothetical protein [Candidatus Pantoea bituminis]|uniref:hypothetical protein n=1 Tax=Candidatus Pantoea bituminis TaxID=2831036 RepID=UPI001C060BE8|nr:hypothetical protein [Pantoea bituminis]